MHALVYHGPGQKAWEEVRTPVLIDDTDAIVRVDATTICGTDLHILKGGVGGLVTHHFAMGAFAAVYDTFARAADTGALKVVVTP